MEKRKGILAGFLELGSIDAQIAMLKAAKDFAVGLITKEQFDATRTACKNARQAASENRTVQNGHSEN